MKKINLIFLFLFTGCATYHFGTGDRTLPGGYDRVAVPMFVNKTHEVGIETYFTENLRTEFDRGTGAHLTNSVDAQLVLEGTIVAVTYAPIVQINNTSTQLVTPALRLIPAQAGTIIPNPLPGASVLNKQYEVVVTVHVDARKNSDNSILWNRDFTYQRPYLAPLLGTPMLANGTPGINSASPLYNQESRNETIADLSHDMMAEAHDVLIENF
jgi:hypothetical protein